MNDERSKINLLERASYVQLNKPNRRTCDSKAFPWEPALGGSWRATRRHATDRQEMQHISRQCSLKCEQTRMVEGSRH
jgi:hypothetical protein